MQHLLQFQMATDREHRVQQLVQPAVLGGQPLQPRLNLVQVSAAQIRQPPIPPRRTSATPVRPTRNRPPSHILTPVVAGTQPCSPPTPHQGTNHRAGACE
ncbi:hypothetical protein GCM10009735_74040 [Actinomadura chokoriensis]